MFGHRPKPKRFKHKFQHYNPEDEKSRRERLKIRRPHKKYHQGRSVLMYAVLLSMVLYIIYIL